jgi:hypothetical protein
MEKLKALWRKFVAFHSRLLIANMTKMTAESYQENLDHNFAAAKRLSDFIGLIIRWSFAQFAGYYFYQVSHSAEFWLTKFVFGYCAFVAYVVTVYMGVYVAIITLLYWSKDAAAQSSKGLRIYIIGLSIAVTVMLWFGIMRMVREIAKASALLGS